MSHHRIWVGALLMNRGANSACGEKAALGRNSTTREALSIRLQQQLVYKPDGPTSYLTCLTLGPSLPDHELLIDVILDYITSPGL